MLEKLMRLALLYDFYGPLLTGKQQKFIELYYHQDWSLGEIATHFRISRQAVHDLLRRAEAALEEYEDRLGLIARFWEQRAALEELTTLFADVEEDVRRGQLARLQGRVRAGKRLLRRLSAEM